MKDIIDHAATGADSGCSGSGTIDLHERFNLVAMKPKLPQLPPKGCNGPVTAFRRFEP
jgi:hypothetical protein